LPPLPSDRIAADQPTFSRYLHITGLPAIRLHGDSTVYLDASWERDLSHHTYLGERVTVLCPQIEVASIPPGHVPFTGENFEFVPLPGHAGTLRYIATGRLVRAMARTWAELASADIMFASLIEHPLPFGWFAFPMAWLRKVVAYTFVESAPWQSVPQLPSSRRSQLRSAIRRRMNRLVLPLIDFAAVSQPAYETLLATKTPRVVTPASWFLPEELAPETKIEQRSDSGSRSTNEPPVVLFAGRLDAAKGVGPLLDALLLLDRDGLGPITIRLLGTGPMASDIDALAARLGTVNVERLEPVTYGPEFFALFRGVDCVVVPSLSDEQPRIVFDAASQGVAVIGSDTTGIRSVVERDVTGSLVAVGSVDALAAALGKLRDADERRRFLEMGMRAWVVAKDYDHIAMHQRRAAFVADLFGGKGASSRTRRRGRRTVSR